MDTDRGLVPQLVNVAASPLWDKPEHGGLVPKPLLNPGGGSGNETRTTAVVQVCTICSLQSLEP